ncbi:DUF4440 domain-containing protein [Granulicella sp. L60]|jgi:hypothetical protein|uniref:nuclear transport factor 2 family protein n=1 Tax=Granulicella sp. L60 TaxID=1641866 RepID=UPI00131CEBCD|nr:DUF4440 domain-containing protein [Granulicella sp. L60]
MKNPTLQDQLFQLEERLFHPNREADRNALIPLFAKDYKEFCTSGRIFNRQHTIQVLLTSNPPPTTLLHFNVEPLSENAALATYRATNSSESSHRSSLWVFRDNHWQLLFHQGTTAS